MSASEMNEIPDNTKYLISGYIRKMEAEVENDIPEVIMMIILSFYYIAEYFKDTECDLSEDNTKILGGYLCCNRNAYGNIIIDSMSNGDDGIYHWQFEIGCLTTDTVAMGITESTSTPLNPIYTVNGKGYAYMSSGSLWKPNSTGDSYNLTRNKPKYKEGDVVEMILNLDEKSLLFKVNNNESCSIENIKTAEGIHYRMAGFLGCSVNWIRLISYQQGAKCEVSGKNTEE